MKALNVVTAIMCTVAAFVAAVAMLSGIAPVNVLYVGTFLVDIVVASVSIILAST